MKTIPVLMLLAGTSILLGSCKKNTYEHEQPVPGNLVSPRLLVTEGTNPFTGAVDLYPCQDNSAIYYGNYVDNKLSPFNGVYTIEDGSVYSALRPVTLPVGTYNMVYWGVSHAQEPTFSKGAIIEPRLILNGNLGQQQFSLRRYSSATDSTFYPVFDFVYGKQPVSIGEDGIAVSLKRVVAGLTVILRKEDGSKFDPQIASINIQVGNIAEHMNFETAEPENQTKTVRFPVTIAADSLTATNPVVLLFPSAPKPPVTIVIHLKDGSIRTFRTQLANTLTANTKTTVTINMGRIFTTETSGGGFEVTRWQEQTETVDASQVS